MNKLAGAAGFFTGMDSIIIIIICMNVQSIIRALYHTLDVNFGKFIL